MNVDSEVQPGTKWKDKGSNGPTVVVDHVIEHSSIGLVIVIGYENYRRSKEAFYIPLRGFLKKYSPIIYDV
jgi:hypothetical protein